MPLLSSLACQERAQDATETATGGGFSRVLSPALFLQIAVIAMQRNWVMQYSNSRPRPQRFDAPDSHWLDLQDSLNRWGGGQTWQRLQNLGAIARIDQNG